MKLVYSFWSNPIAHDEVKLQKNRWLYALSVTSAKLQGFKTVLHTDNIGHQLLGDLPFDEIKITLQDVKIDKCFWASTKMIAMSHESAPFIHVDGDVSFRTNEVAQLMKETDYDVIVQSTELGYSWDKSYAPYIHEVKEMCSLPFDYSIKKAYNCGIVGFKNNDIKNEFIADFFIMVSELQKAKNKTELMVLLEQWNLMQVATRNNAKVFSLIGDEENWKYLAHKAKQIGYTHLLGGIKWEENIINIVKDRVLEYLLKLRNK